MKSTPSERGRSGQVVNCLNGIGIDVYYREVAVAQIAEGRDNGRNSSDNRLTTAMTFSGVVPLWWGIGPAGTVSYVPSQKLLCIGGGVGASAGHNIAGGPVLVNEGKAKDVLSGFSVSGGYNLTPLRGTQGSWNPSGTTGGYAMGIPGAAGAITYSKCAQF